VQAVHAVRPVDRALAEVGGVNIHAEVAFDGRDRKQLERVLRYMARPPLALDRLEQRSDGNIVYRFKKPWRDGTHAVVLSPQDFIARLCALVPTARRSEATSTWPRFHLLRYYGVLSAHASLRAEVVPKKAVVPVVPPAQLPLFEESGHSPLSAKAAEPKTAEPSRHPWSWLLRRVFALDVLVCARCGGALRIVKIATRPDDHVLGVLGSLRSLCARSARGGARSWRARFAARSARGRADRDHSRPARASIPLSSPAAPRAR